MKKMPSCFQLLSNKFTQKMWIEFILKCIYFTLFPTEIIMLATRETNGVKSVKNSILDPRRMCSDKVSNVEKDGTII